MLTPIVTALEAAKIIAIIRLDDYTYAREIAGALLEGGITALEFTLTGQGATTAIKTVCEHFGDRLTVGVGTVLTPDQAIESIAAGAQFVVTPVFRPAVLEVCQQAHIVSLSGAYTPSEIQLTYEAGATMVKVFPANQLGPSYIKNVLAPLPHLPLVPTGGIQADNVKSYLEAGARAVGIGGNLVNARTVAAQNWQEITAQARACIEAIRA